MFKASLSSSCGFNSMPVASWGVKPCYAGLVTTFECDKYIHGHPTRLNATRANVVALGPNQAQ